MSGSPKKLPYSLIRACKIGELSLVAGLLSSLWPGDEARLIDAQEDTSGRSLLHYACLNGDERLVEMLLEKGADPFLLDEGGNTSLHLACEKGNAFIVKMLLDNGSVSVINQPNYCGSQTPLYLACLNGEIDCARLLLSSGALFCVEGVESIVAAACYSGKLTLLNVLQDFLGKEVFLSELKGLDGLGSCALSFACEAGHVTMVEWLLAQLPPESIHAPGRFGMTPLNNACKFGRHFPLIKNLLDKGAKSDINLPDDRGVRPLHRVALWNVKKIKETITLLLSAGANPSLLDVNGGSALYFACSTYNSIAIHVLLEHGVEALINQESSSRLLRTTVLSDVYSAQYQGKVKSRKKWAILNLLLAYGACPYLAKFSYFSRRKYFEKLLADEILQIPFKGRREETTFKLQATWKRRLPWLEAIVIYSSSQMSKILTHAVVAKKSRLTRSPLQELPGSRLGAPNGGAGEPSEQSFDEDIATLLKDPRLVRVEQDSKLVYSLIVGKAAQFLSGCCEEERCSRNKPVLAGVESEEVLSA